MHTESSGSPSIVKFSPIAPRSWDRRDRAASAAPPNSDTTRSDKQRQPAAHRRGQPDRPDRLHPGSTGAHDSGRTLDSSRLPCAPCDRSTRCRAEDPRSLTVAGAYSGILTRMAANRVVFYVIEFVWRMQRRRWTMRSDLVAGAGFPDYQLPDHTGALRKLSELQGDDPLILTLSRGHYCPKAHQQHRELAEIYPKIAVGYTQMATISTDDHHTLLEFRASLGAQWTFLSDPGRTVQRDLDIAEYTDPEHNPMIPHTLVLRPGLVILRIYNGFWFWGRPSVFDLWHDLRAVTSQIRPDWDLSTPGLREAWNAGDKSSFHGWNKGKQAPR